MNCVIPSVIGREMRVKTKVMPVPPRKPVVSNGEPQSKVVVPPVAQGLLPQVKNFALLAGQQQLSPEQQQKGTQFQALVERRQETFARYLPADTRTFQLPVGPELKLFDALSRELPLVLGDEGFAEQEKAVRAFFYDEQKSALSQLETLLAPGGSKQADLSPERIAAYESVLTSERASEPGAKLELVVLKKGRVARDPLTVARDGFAPPLDVVIKITNSNGSSRYIAIDDEGKATSGQGSLTVSPGDTLLSVDASDIGPNQRPGTMRATIDVSGSVEVQKNKGLSFYSVHGKKILAPFFSLFIQQHNQSQTYDEVPLRNMIGSAIQSGASRLPRELTPGQLNAEDEAALKEGHFDFFGDVEAVDNVAAAITKHGGVDARVLPLPTMHVNPFGEPTFHALFQVTDKNDKVALIDEHGRHYNDLVQWKSEHLLPPGKIFLVQDGQSSAASSGNPQLEMIDSHNTELKTGIEKGLTAAAIVAGIVIGKGVLGQSLLARGAQFLLATGTMAGAASPIVDKFAHGQTPEAHEYLAPVTAWSSSLVVLTKMAQLPRISTMANRAAGLAGTLSVANGAHELSGRWNQLTTEERWIYGLNVAFFGTLTGRRLLS